ncbi:hypothetical protein CMI44_01305 [Candidatus Pacearchaeota archaeon]|nr:hypothetical protein [Candidatus Pacearchaeota archaeon]|tara:strand:- start:1046 stop:1249 length:204 start_codon:yes stop_codon:yes gene_type:complete
MAQKKASELKEGDTIIVYGEKAVVKKIETSGKGIKQGKIKCRIEAESVTDKKPVTIIRLADDLIEAA